MIIARAGKLLAAALVFSIVPVAAQAQFTMYTDFASYLAAVSNAGTDTFDDFNNSMATPGPINRTAGAYGYRGTTSPDNNFYGAGPDADRWLSTNLATNTMIFDNFTSGVYGIGGLFFGSNIVGEFRGGVDIVLSATNSGGTTSVTVSGTTLSTFRGFVSENGEVLSFSIASVEPAEGGFAWPTVNNLVLGGAPGTVVPEPSTYAMMAIGLLGLGVAARRRRVS